MDAAIIPQDNLFAAHADAQRIAIGLGRTQMAVEISRILNTEQNNGRAIAQILALCNREAK